jgi:hypothetical protein
LFTVLVTRLFAKNIVNKFVCVLVLFAFLFVTFLLLVFVAFLSLAFVASEKND